MVINLLKEVGLSKVFEESTGQVIDSVNSICTRCRQTPSEVKILPE